MTNDGHAEDRSASPRSGAGRNQQKVARLLEQLPPHAIEAEMCVLSSVILKPTVLDEVTQLIGPDDFYKPAHGAIFQAMIDLYERNRLADIVDLHQLLVDRDILEAVGGQEYLVELASSVPSASNAEHYATLVQDKAVLRRVIEQAGQILQMAYGHPEDTEAIVDRFEAAAFTFRRRDHQHRSVRIDKLHESSLDCLDTTKQSDDVVPTGFADLDDMTGGFVRGEFTVVAARPSMGKTALAINIATHIARTQVPVAYFSLEMTGRAIDQRVLSTESGVSSYDMRRRTLRSDQFERLYSAAGLLTPLHVYVDDSPSLTMMQLRSKARLLVLKHEVKVVFVDYMQRLHFERRTESRRVEVGEISRAMKELASDLDVAVVCLSQLNRGADARQNHRPRLSDLKESGDIEQDADTVILLHREDYYQQHKAKFEPTNIAELNVAKQRNGPTGAITLVWDGNTMTFRNHSKLSDNGSSTPAQAHGGVSQQGVFDEVGSG